MTYEQTIERLIADLRIDVAEALHEAPRSDARMLVEIVNNATDFMQHQLTVLRVVRASLKGSGNDALARTLEATIAAAPTLRTEQAQIMADYDEAMRGGQEPD